MRIKTRAVLKYSLTPQIWPRLEGLFYSGFSYVAFFMAQIYRAVRLLPDGHPYLSPENMGRFGIRHVLIEAGNNLVISKDTIDQVLIYGLMILGMLILAAQLAMLFMAGFVDVAHAAVGALLYGSSDPRDFFFYFETPDATHELAFVLLDRVFGLPGYDGPTGNSFFNDRGGGYSCVVTGVTCFDLGQSSRIMTPDDIIYTDYARVGTHDLVFPWPFHEALRGMIQVYSIGLMAIGVFIFLYFVFALGTETVQTGTPFGKRFNQIWSPFRIVMAMGLLVPIAHGLNPAQWILMYGAKWGSSFATNGWIIYNEALTGEDTLLGDVDTLVARPETPPINRLTEFGSILGVCYEAYMRMYHERPTRPQVDLEAWLINPNDVTMAPLNLEDTDFVEAVTYFRGGKMHVRFGELRDQPGAGSAHQSWDGEVAPFCGELTLDMTYMPEDVGGGFGGVTEPGSWFMLSEWYDLMRNVWCSASGECADTGFLGGSMRDFGIRMADRHLSIGNNPLAPLPTAVELSALREAFEGEAEVLINAAVLLQRQSPEWFEQLLELGWGGAAIWYNKVAQINGGLISAVQSLPMPKNYPYVMEEIWQQRAGSDSSVSAETAGRFRRGTDAPVHMSDDEGEEIGKAMFHMMSLWRENNDEMPLTANAFIDGIISLFGLEGLMNITANEAENIHPLALLAAIGRSIVDSSIRNLGYSMGAGMASLLGPQMFGQVAGTSSSFLVQVAMIGLAVGFVLFYVIPFLPFIYFFFAVGGWIKAILEAMVGVPLWALAHIRIDGNGLPGDAAMGGYYLILEIFLRPVLIIFGFIASITLFSAQVQILHEVWDLVVSNTAGFDSYDMTKGGDAGSIEYLRGILDEFFFTIVYTIMVYMLGMSSFKLIDLIPNHLLRWMGASVSTFGDQNTDPAQNLVRNSFIGANMVSNPMRQAAGSIGTAAQQGRQAMAELGARGQGG